MINERHLTVKEIGFCCEAQPELRSCNQKYSSIEKYMFVDSDDCCFRETSLYFLYFDQNCRNEVQIPSTNLSFFVRFWSVMQ